MNYRRQQTQLINFFQIRLKKRLDMALIKRDQILVSKFHGFLTCFNFPTSKNFTCFKHWKTSIDFVTINTNHWLIDVSNLNLAGYLHLNVGLISLKIDLLSVILLHSEFKLEELLRIIQLYYKKN